MMTPWFEAGVLPVRDGLYITAYTACSADEGRATCWHFMRWVCATGGWYSAGSVGHSKCDEISGGGANAHLFDWRGLAAPELRGGDINVFLCA